MEPEWLFMDGGTAYWEPLLTSQWSEVYTSTDGLGLGDMIAHWEGLHLSDVTYRITCRCFRSSRGKPSVFKFQDLVVDSRSSTSVQFQKLPVGAEVQFRVEARSTWSNKHLLSLTGGWSGLVHV